MTRDLRVVTVVSVADHDQLEVRLKLDHEVLELARAAAVALTSIARALDTGAADQALIAAKLRPIADRLDKLNIPDPPKE